MCQSAHLSFFERARLVATMRTPKPVSCLAHQRSNIIMWSPPKFNSTTKRVLRASGKRRRINQPTRLKGSKSKQPHCHHPQVHPKPLPRTRISHKPPLWFSVPTHFPAATPIPGSNPSLNPNFSSHTPSAPQPLGLGWLLHTVPLPRPRSPSGVRSSPQPLPALLHAPENLPPSTAGSPASSPEARPRHVGQASLLPPFTPAPGRPGREIPHIEQPLRERGLGRTTSDPLVPPLLAAPGQLECGVASRVPQGVGVQAGTPQRQILPGVGAEGKEVPWDSPRACCQH